MSFFYFCRVYRTVLKNQVKKSVEKKGSITFIAHWRPNKLIVNYYGNGADYAYVKGNDWTQFPDSYHVPIIKKQDLIPEENNYHKIPNPQTGYYDSPISKSYPYDYRTYSFSLTRSGHRGSGSYKVYLLSGNKTEYKTTITQDIQALVNKGDSAKVNDFANSIGVLTNLQDKDTTVNLYAEWEPCHAGYYCPADQEPQKCTAGSYCPQGSSSPISCGGGRWSKGGASTFADCKLIDARCYGSSASNSCPNTCTKGTYSATGFSSCLSCNSIEHSTWLSNGYSETSCDFKCDNGYYKDKGECKPITYHIDFVESSLDSLTCTYGKECKLPISELDIGFACVSSEQCPSGNGVYTSVLNLTTENNAIIEMYPIHKQYTIRFRENGSDLWGGSLGRQQYARPSDRDSWGYENTATSYTLPTTSTVAFGGENTFIYKTLGPGNYQCRSSNFFDINPRTDHTDSCYLMNNYTNIGTTSRRYTQNLSLHTPTKEGFRFLGWYTYPQTEIPVYGVNENIFTINKHLKLIGNPGANNAQISVLQAKGISKRKVMNYTDLNAIVKEYPQQSYNFYDGYGTDHTSSNKDTINLFAWWEYDQGYSDAVYFGCKDGNNNATDPNGEGGRACDDAERARWDVERQTHYYEDITTFRNRYGQYDNDPYNIGVKLDFEKEYPEYYSQRICRLSDSPREVGDLHFTYTDYDLIDDKRRTWKLFGCYFKIGDTSSFDSDLNLGWSLVTGIPIFNGDRDKWKLILSKNVIFEVQDGTWWSYRRGIANTITNIDPTMKYLYQNHLIKYQ